MLVVVGASPRAEAADRPLAYALRDRLLAWLAAHGRDAPPSAVLVCTDLWYLNDPALADRPVVSVGGPGVNALAAHWADQLPAAFAIDGVLVVQAHPAMDEPRASCWGADARATAGAVAAFVERYLDDFMAAALGGDGVVG